MKSDTKWNNLLAIEKKLFVEEGILPENVIQWDVFVAPEEHMHYVEVTGSEKSQETLVVLHGYGGGAYVYFKIAKYLQDFYWVIYVDLPGMGFNSRNSYLEDYKEHPEWAEYYVSRLELLM